MPINVSFQPSAAVIADAGYQAGLGEYIARRQAQALQQQQMALQDRHFQQDLQARLYQQNQNLQANQNSQVFHAAQQFGLLDAQQQHDADRMEWARANALTDQQTRRGWDVADQKTLEARQQAQWNHSDQQLQDQRNYNWAAQGAQQIEADTTKGMANYEAQSQYMSPEGKRLLSDLTGKFRAIQKQRASLRPEQYAGLIGQFRQDVQAADLDSRIQKPKTIAERIPSESYHEPVHDPSGEFMGYNVWTSTTRNGQSTLTPKFIPKPKSDALDTSKVPQSFEHLYANRETFAKDFAATQKELMAEAKANAAEDGSVPSVSHADVVQAMRDKFNAWKSINGGAPSSPGQQVGEAMAAFYQQAMQQPAAQDQPVPDAMPSPEQTVPPPPPTQPPPPPPKSVPVNSVQHKIAGAVLPKPKTPAEAASLPSGTLFIGPDGKTRRVP